jgi:uncharacterized RDD family membrane protein YckC
MTNATFGQRCKALGYDFLFSGLLLTGAMIYADRLGLVRGMVVGWISMHLVYWGYRVIGHARWGQTPGKSLAGIKVVRLDGGALSWRQALLREVDTFSVLGIAWLVSSCWAVLHIPDVAAYAAMDWTKRTELRESLELVPAVITLWAPVITGGVELLVVTLTGQKRAVHDLVAGTRVIDVRPGADAPREVIPRRGWWLAAAWVQAGIALLVLLIVTASLTMDTRGEVDRGALLFAGVVAGGFLLLTGFLFARRRWAQRTLCVLNVLAIGNVIVTAFSGRQLSDLFAVVPLLVGLWLLVRASPALVAPGESRDRPAV